MNESSYLQTSHPIDHDWWSVGVDFLYFTISGDNFLCPDSQSTCSNFNLERERERDRGMMTYAASNVG